MTSRKLAICWIASFIFAIAIVKLTSIGEVILVISEKHGMGVHVFDLVVFIPIIFSMIATVRWWKNR